MDGDFTEQLTPEVYEAYTTAVHELGSRQAVFDANEALTAMAQYVVIGNVGDVVRVLDYLVSIGTLETVERETPDGPARWRYIG